MPVPLAVTVDGERSWMLLCDFGGRRLRDAEAAQWDQALHAFAQMQRDLAGRVDELVALGCVDRRLGVLAAQARELPDDPEVQAVLDAAEVERLRAQVPRLQAMCAELAGYGVPASLVHGDLHASNVAVRDGACVFFDWTDACVAHPFFDLVTLLDARVIEERPGEGARLLDVYLREWLDDEPLARLHAVWKLAEPLGTLHQVVSYRNIVASLEPTSKHELSDGLRYFARRLLAVAT
jgi:Ser/Thr protein kinase RdoA (MazF antagonist)